MIVIGELINGMYKAVTKAIQERDAILIQHLAQDQVKAGASILDVSAGPFSKDPVADMKWLVETIQKASLVPLSLDSTRTDVVEECLKLTKKRAVINSTNADPERMETVFGLAKKYNSQVIGIAIDKSGVPNSVEKRVELAASIVAKAIDFGINIDDLYLDPIAMPINVAQSQCIDVLEAIRQFRTIYDPAPKTVIGLSNVSQGSKKRGLINRTYLAMAIASGLQAVIMDPLDKDLVDAMITAELIANKNIYCDSFLEAYRKK
jgi:5-methyltetrahydrofolate corrinoid/iron sulfur protein methyltransferase